MEKKNRILLVDDDQLILDSLQQLLQRQGWDISLVESGEEALVEIQHNGFDVMILDLNLKDMNGLEVLERANSPSLCIDTLILTGYGTVSVAVEAIQRGAKDFLEKPYNSKEIIAKIQGYLNERTAPKNVIAERMDRYLKSHLQDSNLRLSTLVEHFGISRSYVCYLFRETLNMTFRQRLARHRIDEAKNLLLSTREPISGIAYRCGFKNPQQFRDVFFRLERRSPSQFKKISVMAE